MKKFYMLFCTIFLFSFLHAQNVITNKTTENVLKSPLQIQEREKLAKSDAVRYKPTTLSLKSVSTSEIAEALGLNPLSVPITYSGVDAQVGVFPTMGVMVPSQGTTFVLLSSGIAGAGTDGRPSPQSGTNMGTSEGSMYDPARITIGPITVPANQYSVRFDFFFLSAEYPEYVGSQYNDLFHAYIYGSSVITNGTNFAKDPYGNAITINSVSFALNENQIPGTGYESVGGGTGLLTAIANVNPGDVIRLELLVADIGDHIYDSQVMLDNVRFSTQSGETQGSIVLTPNNVGMLVGGTKNIVATITSPAPSGGLTINLSASNPSVISYSPSSLFVPSGQNQATQQITITANNWGQSSLVATAVDYLSATSTIRVGTDLSIQKSDIEIISSGSSTQIIATVHNNGIDIENVEVQFIEYNLENSQQKQIGGLEIIPEISEDGSVTISKNYIPSSANANIIVNIDQANKVIESNELNNSASKAFTLEKPVISSVTAKYDRDPHPDIFGRFMTDLTGTLNTFYAIVNGNVARVEFTLDGKTIVDNEPSDGWTAEFDMGLLPVGLNNLIVRAYSDLNVASVPIIKKIKVDDLPDWIKVNFNPSSFSDKYISDSHITFKLTLSESTFIYIAKIKEDVMFLPKDDIGGNTKVTFEVGIPLDATLGWKVGGKVSFKQKIFKQNTENELQLLVFLNADNTLHSFQLSYEGSKIKIFGVSIKQKYPLPVSGLNAVVGGGIDVYAKLKLQMVTSLINNQIKFVVTPDGEKSQVKPGIGIDFNLLAGLEVLFGLVSGQLVLSPEFNIDLGATYVTYPANEGLKTVFGGEGQVGWKVIGSLFWGTFETELFGGVFGPWQLFGNTLASMTSSKFDKSKFTINNIVQLPSSLPLPSISTDEFGNVMVVWLEKENTPNAPPQVLYSFKPNNGTFASPQFVINNSYYKSDPKIVFNPDGTANAVWVQNSKDEAFAATHPTLSEVLRFQDVYYSFWNKTSWSTPVLVTNETIGQERSDGVPTIIVSPDESEKLVLWTRNSLNNSLERTGLEIMYAKETGGTFSSPLSLTTNNFADLMVRGCYYDNKKAVAVWIRDEDGSQETVGDNEIYYSKWDNEKWENPQRLTNNENQEKDLSITSLKDGGAIVTWVEVATEEDSTLQYYLKSAIFDNGVWSSPDIIYSSNQFIETPIVNVDARNIATVTWRGYYQNINGDILISVRDFRDAGSSWTSPKPITNDNLIDWMIATAVDASSNQYFVNLKSTTESMSGSVAANKQNFFGGLTLTVKGIRSNGQVSDELNFGNYLIAADLVVDSNSITVVDSLLHENETSDLFIHIKNIGGIASDSTRVHVFNGNPLQGGIQVGSDVTIPKIPADSSVVLQVPYLFQSVNNIYVQIDTLVQEQSKVNNIASKTIVLLPDLVLEDLNINFVGAPSIELQGTVNVTIKNIGQKAIDSVTLQFLDKGNDTGSVAQEFFTTTLYDVKPDTVYAFETPYTVFHNGTTHILANIDPANSIDEITETNNTLSTSFKVLPDVRIDSIWYNLQTQRINTIVTNTGGDTAREFDVYFYNGDPLAQGYRIGSVHKTNLAPNGIDTSFIQYIPSAGLSNFYCWLDSIGTLQELSLENNKTYASVILSGSVDLTSTFTSVDSFYPVGVQFPLVFKISNVGSSGANTIDYQIIARKVLTGTDSLLGTHVISILNPQESFSDTMFWTFPDTSLYEFKILVDPFNAAVELDETNNTATSQSRGYINNIPSITSVPSIDAYEDSLYQYQIFATDADSIYGDHLSYEIIKPAWMLFDTTALRLQGIPLQQNVGTDTIVVCVFDKAIASDTQKYTITVHAVNDPPIVTGIPDTSFAEDDSLALYLDDYVTDEDNMDAELHWSVQSATDFQSTITNIVQKKVKLIQTKKTIQQGTSLQKVGTRNDDVRLFGRKDKNSIKLMKAKEEAYIFPKIELQKTNTHLRVLISQSGILTDSVEVKIDTVTHLAIFYSTLNFYGEKLPFIFTATDLEGLSGQDTMKLSVTPVNDPPVLSQFPDTSFNEDETLSFPLSNWYLYVNDVDNEDSALYWTITPSDTAVKVNIADKIVHISAFPNWNGTDSLTVVVRDTSEASDTVKFRLIVKPVNDSPIVADIPDTSFVEDGFLFFDLDNYVTDVDNTKEELHWNVQMESNLSSQLSNILQKKKHLLNTKTVADEEKPSLKKAGVLREIKSLLPLNQKREDIIEKRNLETGSIPKIEFVKRDNSHFFATLNQAGSITDSLEVKIDTSTHIVTFHSTLNFYGESLPFIFTAIDPSNASGQDTMRLTVLAVNDPPVLSQLPDTAFNEDETLMFPLSMWYPYVNDVDNNDSTLLWSILPHDSTSINASISEEGEVYLSAASNWFGVDSLQVVVSDVGELKDTATLRIIVRPINDAPIPFALVNPQDQDTIKLQMPAVPISFTWWQSKDIDQDSLWYFLRIKGQNVQYDTTLVLRDTSISLNIMNRLSVSQLYNWSVRVTDRIDTINSFSNFSFRTSNTITGVDDWHNLIPKEYVLEQNYPNPFNPATTIRYGLPMKSSVKLEIYNILGQRITTLANEVREAGYYEEKWFAPIASGVYFYRLEAVATDNPGNHFVETKKMLLLK